MARDGFDAAITLTAGGAVAFSTPEGSRHVGVVRSLSDRDVVVDFNQPVAGRALRFEAEVVAVL